MPPRKKNRQQVSKRKRPVLPDGSIDSSMQLEDRRHKLDDYLNDFDIHAEEIMKRMRIHGNTMISKIRAIYRQEIMKYSNDTRKMKLCDFLAQGGEVNNAAMKEASNNLTELANAVFKNAPQTSERPPLTEAHGNADFATPAPVTTGRTTRSTAKRTGTAAKRAPRTAKRNQTKTENQFVTPAASRLPQNYQTPFVTPKFDPRLPITPAFLREAKAGERIMSLSGSPLANRSAPETVEAFIPIGEGKTFQLSSATELSPRSLPTLNDVGRKNLELLQMQLSRLLKVPNP
ncbi:predicted protein [Nematostella vectensis]|uniref:Borealin n=1 Tax=Nematostella vectensis TaxID=45351 RepID=A7SY18_NEMVE|nr:predicted protein [Nematostella vectensis]|eukprot:XP_001623503.1 predicted protein [Nematostella vectensis]